ncbi:non-functional pseudokinase ZED1-like [Olea europaea var. sylvestris]|uniref:non-functional pseudokinase ZED1-like n=1 Tax=Olea europaea var. sylvestris TaxID=158386 RepID=UPI000C1D74CA|nr:non-functional pseudokinase ZED1-like [Olea europaea var. sylvestris]
MRPLKKLMSCLRPKQKEEISVEFLKNGGELLEEPIASFGGRHRIPIVSFSAEELIRATNDFAQCVHISENGYLFKGCLGERPVLLKMFHDEIISPRKLNGAIIDIVITSQISHLKNVLKLIGCCLEFKYPAMVYEDAGIELLTDLLYNPNNDKFFHWKSRLKVAADIAYVIAYLHAAFPRPVIYNRELRADKVIINRFGVTKLFDFSNSVMLPPGEFQVKDFFWIGDFRNIDPEYAKSKAINQKTDVYSIGLLLLNLLAGQHSLWPHPVDEIVRINKSTGFFHKDQLKHYVDQKITEEGGNEAEMQLQNFLDIAHRCIQYTGEDRPDMMTVAKRA